jgi:hypothetical protein
LKAYRAISDRLDENQLVLHKGRGVVYDAEKVVEPALRPGRLEILGQGL